MAQYDKSLSTILTNLIYKSCFKEVFRGKIDVEAAEEEDQALETCLKNYVESFKAVSDGYKTYVMNIPTHLEKEAE